MDISSTLSNTGSKQTVLEETSMTFASLEEAKKRENDAISNERIQKGDLILDTYEVTSDAISGGMGSVWRVHHKSWNTDLAMKRPQPKYFAEGSGKRKEQFIAECENWINLGLHPNIVSCYYVREIGGVPSIFSEWMDGGSLKDRIQDGSLYEGTDAEVQERILNIAIQAARGLQYSHDNLLIHQDMKPGNLLLSKGWDAKVADFGLAKAKEQLDDPSETAKTTGYTLAYCPKEQSDGEEPARWMDVYAWALTVFEMYAGKRLWEIGAEAKDHFDEYPSLCAHTIPDGMTDVLRSCLRDQPDGFADIDDRLIAVYRDVTGAEFPRRNAKATDSAGSLNNRALSFIDLEKFELAEECWKKALELNRDSYESIFNRALSHWRRGEAKDVDEAKEILKDIRDVTVREEYEALLDKESQGSLKLYLDDMPKIDWLEATGYSTDKISVNDDDSRKMTYDSEKMRWSVYSADGEVILRFSGRKREVFRLSPDGAWAAGVAKQFYTIKSSLYSVDIDSRLYNVNTGEEFYYESYQFHGFTADNRMLMSTHVNGHKTLPNGENRFVNQLVIFPAEPGQPLPDCSEARENPGILGVPEEFVFVDDDYTIRDMGILPGKTADKLLKIMQKMAKRGLQLKALPHRDTKFFAVLDDGRYCVIVKNRRITIADPETGRVLQNDQFSEDEYSDSELRKIFYWLDKKDPPAKYIPGEKAEYRLSIVESTVTRLEKQDEFDQLLKAAENAYHSGEALRAVQLIDRAMALSGFEASQEALKLRAQYGADLHKTGVRDIIQLRHTAAFPFGRSSLGHESLDRFPDTEKELKERLNKSMLRYIGNDCYSTPQPVVVEPEQLSRDGRFLLVSTLMVEERDSPAAADIELTHFYGAAIIDTASGEIVFYDDSLVSHSDPYVHSPNVKLRFNDDGSCFLFQAYELRIITVGSGEIRSSKLIRHHYEYAEFLDNDRFVLGIDTEQNIHIIDSRIGTVITERKLQYENDYISFYPIDDDCFSVSGTLCWIVWDYEPKKEEAPAEIALEEPEEEVCLPAEPEQEPVSQKKELPVTKKEEEPATEDSTSKKKKGFFSKLFGKKN